MNYGIYKNVRNASWQCLIDIGADSLPVPVLKMAHYFNVNVVKNSSHHLLMPSQNGISFVDEAGKWVIVYDDKDSLGRKRFTIAHEMGHILLGHPLRNGFQHTRTFDKQRPQVESEADMFAARVLAPACVLWGLDLHTPEDIAAVCNISFAAAQVRAKRMDELYKRQKFLISPLEKQLFERFSDYIENNRR